MPFFGAYAVLGSLLDAFICVYWRLATYLLTYVLKVASYGQKVDATRNAAKSLVTIRSSSMRPSQRDSCTITDISDHASQ